MAQNQINLRIRKPDIEGLACVYDQVEVDEANGIVRVFNRSRVTPGSVYEDRRTEHQGMRLVATFHIANGWDFT